MTEKLPHPKVFIDNQKKRDLAQSLLDSHEKLIGLHKENIKEIEQKSDLTTGIKIELEKERMNVINLTQSVESKKNMVKEMGFRIDEFEKNFEKDLAEAKQEMPALVEEAEAIAEKANPKAPFVREIDDLLDIYDAHSDDTHYQLACYKFLKICVSNHKKIRK